MTKQKLNKATEAFNLLFADDGEAIEVIAPKIERIIERNPNATNCYLVIMTGKSGTKINDLYDTTVQIDGREVKLTGKHRLQGSYLRSITEAMNDKGVHGTMSIFNHTVEDANELINEYQKLMVKLSTGTDYKVMAMVHMEEQQLEDIFNKHQQDYFDAELASGRITGTRKGFKFTELEGLRTSLPWRVYNERLNALRSQFKRGQAQHIAYHIGKYIELVK